MIFFIGELRACNRSKFVLMDESGFECSSSRKVVAVMGFRVLCFFSRARACAYVGSMCSGVLLLFAEFFKSKFCFGGEWNRTEFRKCHAFGDGFRRVMNDDF